MIGESDPVDLKPLLALCKAEKLFEVQEWIRQGKPLALPEGVTAVYDRHSHDAEKKEALVVWGKRVAAIERQKTTLKDVSATRAYQASEADAGPS